MVVFLIFARSAKVLATYRGKVINRGNASPCKEGNAGSRKVKGSIPVPAKEISSLVHLEDHLILKIIHFNCVSCIMH